MRILHQSLHGCGFRSDVIQTLEKCAQVAFDDGIDDKLWRREIAERVQRLCVTADLEVLDAMTSRIVPPKLPTVTDDVLILAQAIRSYYDFICSPQGHAYAEVRLALISSQDFRRRFNFHRLEAPQRYKGIWKGTLMELISRLEASKPFLRGGIAASPTV